MIGSAQKRALENYRTRLAESGMARFEVLGLDEDRGLIRSLARRLAENDAAANRLRAAIRNNMAGDVPAKGGILAALRRSPLADPGLELDLTRSREKGRKVEL